MMDGKVVVRIRKKEILLAAIVLFMIIGLTNSVIMGIAMILGVGAVLFLSTAEATSLLFFLMPYANIYKFSMGSASFFSYLQILFAIKLIYKMRQIKKRFMPCIIALCVLYVIGAQSNLSVFVKQISIPVLVYAMLQKDEIDVAQITKSLATGVITSSTMAVIISGIPALDSFVKKIRAYDVSEEAYRFCSIANDPNYYSVVVILSMLGFIILLFQQKVSKSWGVAVVILMYFGAQTLSKSFYLMTAVVFCVSIWLAFKHKRYFIAFGGILLMPFVIGVMLNGRSGVLSQVLQRFENSDLTTGRTQTWKLYFAEFLIDPMVLFFGHGIGAELLNKAAAHNTYIDMLYYYGLFGSVTFITSIVFSIKNKVRLELENLSPFICFLMMGTFLSYVLSYDFALLMVYVFSFLQCEFIHKPKEKRPFDLERASQLEERNRILN